MLIIQSIEVLAVLLGVKNVKEKPLPSAATVTLKMERAMGIEPTSARWQGRDAHSPPITESTSYCVSILAIHLSPFSTVGELFGELLRGPMVRHL